jgi:hypothetical protein
MLITNLYIKWLRYQYILKSLPIYLKTAWIESVSYLKLKEGQSELPFNSKDIKS